MINIIAPNIKSGGGLELLMYLLEYLEGNYHDVNVRVYIDCSLVKKIMSTKNREVIVLDSTLEKIKLFTKRIDNALYFGNLPPLVRSKNSMVYFHNSYLTVNLLELWKVSFTFFLKYTLQQVYVKHFIKNVDCVAVQTSNIKNKFIAKYNNVNVVLLPFFQNCKQKNTEKRFDFCYISLAHPHKNHKLLFDALEILSNRDIAISLVVTVEPDKVQLLKQIDTINKIGVCKVENIGIVKKEKVCEIYSKSRCLIFPSLKESFGLPLIEAVHMDLDVISIDLDYVYDVIYPSLVFQNMAEDLAEQIEKYCKPDSVQKSTTKITNHIDDLISYFA